MELRDNTVLITGGTSGIGLGLAEAFFRLGNRVIIAGRRQEALEQIRAANPQIEGVRLDVTNPADIRRAADEVIRRFGSLNVLINNAGIQRMHDFAVGQPLDERAMLDEIDTNLLGVIRCCSAFLPHLKTQPRAALINVSSGLAFAPLARFPIYCASKAAVHSFTVSLRRQLRGSAVQVIELIPPWVATDLDRQHRFHPPPGGPQPMPLDAFIEQTIQALATDEQEIAIADAAHLRDPAAAERARTLFERMNP